MKFYWLMAVVMVDAVDLQASVLVDILHQKALIIVLVMAH
jgi:hypothetical protein